ncbi:MAG: polymer-forming cytoskeletal protein, partial [Verrucomicrobia bacterium]|nr:polymer-forming cytoskeletal protein [Verrucomicrobiota bacterium]
MADVPDRNNLLKDVEIKGSIKFTNELVFDGNLDGNVSSAEGILIVGENASLRGDVKTKTVILKGTVNGNITVQERCELHANAQLIGDLKAVRLSLEDGATFLGKLEVNPGKAPIKTVNQKPEPQKIQEPQK